MCDFLRFRAPFEKPDVAALLDGFVRKFTEEGGRPQEINKFGI